VVQNPEILGRSCCLIMAISLALLGLGSEIKVSWKADYMSFPMICLTGLLLGKKL
jgi:hypothetical protein